MQLLWRSLFVERARALKPDFQITSSNASALTKLCRELDGLPLALELAAARITHLTPQQLLTRLTRRLDLLAQKRSDAPTRQQTIRQTIGWSYELLTPEKRHLLARLSVFVGGATLADIEALYEQLGEDPFIVLDAVASLTDKSLIFQRAQDDGESRLHQLEIIREFARERLQESGEEEKTRAAHSQYYASLAPLPSPAQLGLAHGTFLAQLKREYHDLLAALHFFMEKGNMEQALQLAVGIGGIWFVNGYSSSGYEEMEHLLIHSEKVQAQVSPILSAMALNLTGRIGINTTDLERATYWYYKSLALSRTLPDKRLLALTIGGLAFAEGDLGDYAKVDVLFAESIPLLQRIEEVEVLARVCMVSGNLWLRRGDLKQARRDAEMARNATSQASGQQRSMAGALHTLGWISYLQHDWGTAHALGQESVALFKQLGIPLLGLEALATFAYETIAIGDPQTAQTLFEELLALGQEAGDTAEVGRAYCGLGYLALHNNNWTKARHLFEDSIRTLLQIKRLATRFTHILASSLEGLASLAAALQQPARAARLLGAADTLRHTAGSTNLLGREIPFWERARETALSTLGTSAFSSAFLQGSHMTPLQALATQEPEKPESPSSLVQSSDPPEGNEGSVPSRDRYEGTLPSGEHLTRRETEVLRLLAQGHSNAQIAETLVLSIVTINSYLRSVYSKLGVSSRTRAARYALYHNLI